MAVKPPKIKTAVVTGAVSGIGLALTQHLLTQAGDSNTNVHWRVVLADINEAAYNEIKTTLNDGHHIFRAFEWSGGRIDFFANNAGIPDRQPMLGWLGRAEAVEKEDLTEPDLSCIDVDLKAVFYGLQCFVHFTRKTRNLLGQKTTQTMDDVGNNPGDEAVGVAAADDFRPKMVVTASMAGQYPFHILPIYTAAKHGCVGFVRAAAPTVFEDEGITLNAVLPSFTKTNIIPEPILEQWPEQNFTPLETIIRAFEELIDVDGRVVQDGLSDGQNGVVKNGCCVETSSNSLFYRDPVPFPSQVQEWVMDQSKKDGIIGKFMRSVMKSPGD